MAKFAEGTTVEVSKSQAEIASLVTDAGDQRSWGEDPGSVPAVHQVVVIYSWVEDGQYHQRAYGPIRVGEADFEGIPNAMLRAERRWKHDTGMNAQVINVTVHVLEPLA